MSNEYDFAYEILLLGRENKIFGASRDLVFSHVLNSFNCQPIKVFQIGAIETFDVAWRKGSGWSDIIFGEYIREHGGKLTIVDVNLNNLAHSHLAASTLNYDMELCYGDAINFITKEDYDIYYLDGSNEPQETLDQFNLIKDKNATIIVDDFNIKGKLLDNNLFDIFNVANGVGIANLRKR